MIYKARLWSMAHMPYSWTIRFSCKWASVSRFPYFDLMYTLHKNVASNTYVDPIWTRVFVASFFQTCILFGAVKPKLAKLESSNRIFWFYLPATLPHLKPSHDKPQHQLELETEHVDTTPLPVQGNVIRNLLATLSGIERGIALHLKMTPQSPHYLLLQEIPCSA